MLTWFERLFAPPTTKAAAAEKPTGPKEPAPERLIKLLLQLKRTGSTDWAPAANLFAQLDVRDISDPVTVARILSSIESLMLTTTGPVKSSLGLAQVTLTRLPEMKKTLATARPVSGAPGLELLEGLLEMRTGRFDRAFPHLAEANRLQQVVEFEKTASVGAVSDPLALSLSLAASTLGSLNNPDLRFWGDVLEALPIDMEAYLDPDAVLTSAGELIMEVYRAAAASLTCDATIKNHILTLAGSRATMLTATIHPDAERARAVVAKIESMLTGGMNQFN